jgi:predicted deacetylase
MTLIALTKALDRSTISIILVEVSKDGSQYLVSVKECIQRFMRKKLEVTNIASHKHKTKASADKKTKEYVNSYLEDGYKKDNMDSKHLAGLLSQINEISENPTQYAKKIKLDALLEKMDLQLKQLTVTKDAIEKVLRDIE